MDDADLCRIRRSFKQISLFVQLALRSRAGISKLFGKRAKIWSAMLRRAKAFKHGNTQCTDIAFIICFARLKNMVL